MPLKKLIQIQNVSAGYNDNIILKDINLTVYEKDYLGIIGPNGGGKTTLLKIILGLIKPYNGTIKYFLSKAEVNRNFIGYLPQRKLFDDRFPITVLDVVLSGLASMSRFFKKYSINEKQKAESLLSEMNISNLKKIPIGDLSGGQLQRVFLCRALISSPRLLILDEPNTFVDKQFENNLYSILKKLNKKMAIILVSHDIGSISTHVKNIACINHYLDYHSSREFIKKIQGNIYGCPVDMIGHGEIPHRVLKYHRRRHD